MFYLLRPAAKKSNVLAKRSRRVNRHGSGDHDDDDTESTRSDVTHQSAVELRSDDEENMANVNQPANLQSSAREGKNRQENIKHGNNRNDGDLCPDGHNRFPVRTGDKRTQDRRNGTKRRDQEPLSFLTRYPDGTIKSSDAFGIPLGSFYFFVI